MRHGLEIDCSTVSPDHSVILSKARASERAPAELRNAIDNFDEIGHKTDLSDGLPPGGLVLIELNIDYDFYMPIGSRSSVETSGFIACLPCYCRGYQ